MTFLSDKALKSKIFREQKGYILAKDVDSRREIKAEIFRIEKSLFFWVTLIQAVVSKTLRLFYKIFFCLQNMPLLEAKINVGGGPSRPPPQSFCLAKGPGP